MSKKSMDRYSDRELLEFKNLILSKIKFAEDQLERYTLAFSNAGNNDVTDTSPTFDPEDGSETSNKEANAELAMRQGKFIRDLRAALFRIENKTYGICIKSGKLIPRERLLVVPHTTMCIEEKISGKTGTKIRIR